MKGRVIKFEPLLMERVWGGRELAGRFGKNLPAGVPVGESWEIVDREEAQSVVVGGEWAGHTLHDLWSQHREGVFGEPYGGHPAERFPLLIKLLDAREKLSLQVHPPEHLAPALEGEPKTEMWFFLDCDPDACIYAGVKPGVGKEEFRAMLENGVAEEGVLLHPVRRGESIFIPSGRLHAIGGGNLIAEIQQNSDTTYRVFDWNRVGLDGKPRELHIEASLASIDFEDHAPEIRPAGSGVLAGCPYFSVELLKPFVALPASLKERFVILGGVEGVARLAANDGRAGVELLPGEFVLISPGDPSDIEITGDAAVLCIQLPV